MLLFFLDKSKCFQILLRNLKAFIWRNAFSWKNEMRFFIFVSFNPRNEKTFIKCSCQIEDSIFNSIFQWCGEINIYDSMRQNLTEVVNKLFMFVINSYEILIYILMLALFHIFVRICFCIVCVSMKSSVYRNSFVLVHVIIELYIYIYV